MLKIFFEDTRIPSVSDYARGRKKRKRVQFYLEWLQDRQCVDKVEEIWKLHGQDINNSIVSTSSHFSDWQHRFWKFKTDRMRLLETEIVALKSSTLSKSIILALETKKKELDELKTMENLHWQQRAKQHWAMWGVSLKFVFLSPKGICPKEIQHYKWVV